MTSSELRNPISGEVKKLTPDKFFELFDEEVHEALRANMKKAPYMVVYRNQQMDSSRFGDTTACIAGPGCTFNSLEAAVKGRLGNLPSNFQYPIGYMETTECINDKD